MTIDDDLALRLGAAMAEFRAKLHVLEQTVQALLDHLDMDAVHEPERKVLRPRGGRTSVLRQE